MDTDDHSGASLRADIGRDCANCGSRLATDQRYCVQLRHPARAAARPGGLDPARDARVRVPPTPVIEKLPPPAAEPRPPLGLTLPTPRVASLAIMAMLSFGVVAGSLTQPGGVEALARVDRGVRQSAGRAGARACRGGGHRWRWRRGRWGVPSR